KTQASDVFRFETEASDSLSGAGKIRHVMKPNYPMLMLIKCLMKLLLSDELYKIIDSSDVVIQILDDRDKGSRCCHLEKHLKDSFKYKNMILLLNKCDLTSPWVTKGWLRLLSKEYPTLAFHASINKSYGKFINVFVGSNGVEKEKIADERHKEVHKASTSKGVESPIGDAIRDESENESSSNSEGLNYEGFTEEETEALRSMINKQVRKAFKNVMPFYISQTTNNLKEIIQKELEVFKKGGMMNDSRNEMATYHDFMAYDVPKFDGMLDPTACTKWLSAVEGAFLTSCCKEKNKVNFALNFLYDSAKMWQEGKIYEKSEEWIGTCTWKEFKKMFTTEFAPMEEVDKIREEFQTLTQTNETVNEMWKKFNDLIHYCPEYHENEKLKVEKFQRMLRDEIREVISPFKCTTLEYLLSRARLRESDLLRKKNKETKRRLEFVDRDANKPKQKQSRRSGHKLNECPNPKAIEAKPLKSIKEEKVEKTGIPTPMARAYMMATKEDKVVCDVVTGAILINPIPARVLYNSGASISFMYFEFSKNLSTSPNELPFPLEVEISSDEIVVLSKVYRDVEIEIDDRVFTIDLIHIVLGAFDIIICMDWLDRYNANILCSQKLVRVENPQGREIIIYGDKRKGEFKLCSMMKARKYMPRGCQAYMAHVVDTNVEKKSAKDVPVVNEFLDVFQKDLPGVSPKRQVEFQIDLIPGETPIAKTLYHLALS
nr:hypothetical protein [Tanacetum cinerariifolium]